MQQIRDLNHIEITLSNQSSVLVLDDGAIITSEDRAMLQALHSRNPKGIKEHLQTLAKKGSGNMMASFYVGYGHKSIGDCGNITIFIEGVSMLCAKAIQDSKLYNGQECSTRYIDFSTQSFFNPDTQDTTPTDFTDSLRAFYIKALPKTINDIKSKRPNLKNTSESIYEKSIKAEAFDILRGFLPAGALTNLAWSTTLRQVADRLIYLRNHPLVEVQNIALAIEEACKKMHPSSFGHKRYDESFVKKYMDVDYYNKSTDTNKYQKSSENDSLFYQEGIDFIEKPYLNINALLDSRPEYTEIPLSFALYGVNKYAFNLDFASYRDLQRHRAIDQKMPFLSTDYGFESWYIDNLPTELQEEAGLLVSMQSTGQTRDQTTGQYFLPMGFRVPCHISGNLPALVYLAETRAKETVHPTLRKIAILLAKHLSKYCKIYYTKDILSPDKRGTQDIVER